MAKRFARYELVSELGRGGQAVVYEARDTRLGRMVALKVLTPRKRRKDDLRRFRREARAVARLNHPNVVSVYDVGTWEGRSYLAMELVRGGSLEDVVAGGGMPVREAMAIMKLVAGAVHCAHWQGIVHRDIKPGNILLDAGGTPKLTDFGLALDAAADTQLTQDGAVMGTVTYMSPEQASGRSHEVDTRSDVYSLGATLYEMLTGRPPFRAVSPLLLLKKISMEEPGRPSMVARAIPQEAETIVMKCLEKDPARRYQTAGQLAEDVRRFLAGEPISARRASLFYVARKGLARHKALATGTFAVIAALVVGLTAAVMQWRSAERALVTAEIAREKAVEARERAEAAEAQEARARAEAAEALLLVETILREKGDLEEALEDALAKAREAAAKGAGRESVRSGREPGTSGGRIESVVKLAADPEEDPEKSGPAREKPPVAAKSSGHQPGDGDRPPDPAAAHAERSADRLGVVDLGGGVEMEFVYISPGRFTMGSDEIDEDERPAHRVEITRGFHIGKYEVTNAQFERLTGKRPHLFEGADMPAVNVSWKDAVAFCSRLSELKERTFRLPTEAEWEYACRAGFTGRYCFGDDVSKLGEYAWYEANSEKKTHPVGRKRPNRWGLHDLHGNAREWCSDWYRGDYYSKSPRRDPPGPASGRFRVTRGGSWNFLDYSCRSANRSGGLPGKGDHNSGFRVVGEGR